MTPILSELDRELYGLSVRPDIDRKTRALILAAGALQAGAKTLAEVCGLLANPNLEGFNLPDETGAHCGAQLVRLYGAAPDTACDSCAFRLGTVPNQCSATIMDAIQCSVTGEAFFCHRTGLVCEGWKEGQRRKAMG